MKNLCEWEKGALRPDEVDVGGWSEEEEALLGVVRIRLPGDVVDAANLSVRLSPHRRLLGDVAIDAMLWPVLLRELLMLLLRVLLRVLGSNCPCTTTKLGTRPVYKGVGTTPPPEIRTFEQHI